MNADVLTVLQKEVYARCQKPSNRFGMGCYYHIEAVVQNGIYLAGKYGADRETVAVACWLHDIASVTEYALYENHHIHGAEMAGAILTVLEYPEEKIPLIQNCIRNHRGSVLTEKQTIEEVCVADADAISHFDSVPSLLYLAYAEKHMDIETGKNFVKEKLERSFQKLSDSSKKLYAEKYHQVMQVLS